MELSRVTTLHVGGPAARYERVTTESQLRDAALSAWSDGDEWLVLGGGSNLVVSDAGFEGSVIHVATTGMDRLEDAGGRVRLRVQAGESWDGLVAHAVAHGWSGIEALSGIPGSAGAAPIQNIGAYGQELSGSLVAIQFLDYLTGEVERVSADDLQLGYRTSALKRGRQGVVLSIDLELADSPVGTVGYEQLAGALGVEVGARVPIADIRSQVLALRASKGMVLDPADPDTVSCGSFFTNPIVSERFAHGLPPQTPRWLQDDDTSVKLSAAWLIEQAGIGRGFALPGSRAAISSKHTLAITNRGGASAEQVAELSRYVRAQVANRFGVELQPEPIAVGVAL
ncbi:MAG: UDP-N-acetylmuramate dehydrogenase [Actinobacteria bacterium]|nr:UDP-N-acetylmuramate dehydrogenase [Actinomycetota bacterium]